MAIQSPESKIQRGGLRIPSVEPAGSRLPWALAALSLALTGLLILACQALSPAPPTVVSVWPPSDTTGTSLDATFQFTFSKPMNHATTEISFQTDPYIQGAFVWNGNTLAYRHEWVKMAPMTKYSILIGVGAQSSDGAALAAPFTSSFTTSDTDIQFPRVYLLGRLATQGWFDHWGRDTIYHRQFRLTYQPVPAAPGVVSSATRIVDNRGLAGDWSPIVFLTLGFDDFTGGRQDSAQVNLQRNESIIQQVYDTVALSRGLRLIVGNALPQAAVATDQWLVLNHRQYNAWLDTFARVHDSLRVFDFYSVLADANGDLKSQYAPDTSASYINEPGYTALDTILFPLLEKNY